jgi:hypothetical protein
MPPLSRHLLRYFIADPSQYADIVSKYVVPRLDLQLLIVIAAYLPFVGRLFHIHNCWFSNLHQAHRTFLPSAAVRPCMVPVAKFLVCIARSLD